MSLDWTRPARAYSIAHRGASAYAAESSFRAFEIAAELGADFWEVDIRLTADNQLIVYHDPELPDGRAIKNLSFQQIDACSKGEMAAPLLENVLELASKHAAGIYADIKDTGAAVPAFHALRKFGIERAIVGAFDPEAAKLLKEAGCSYPRSALVPIGADPFEHAKGADIIHLCWERMHRPQDLMTEYFFRRAEQENQLVVLWHEEDPERMAALRHMPVIGICSDRPELVQPFSPPQDWPVQIICHRGANRFAPENTVEAAHCAFAAGFSHVEIDVRTTSDDQLVVIHDRTVDRTTDGTGVVAELPLASLKSLDAGSWFSPRFKEQTIPTLDEILQTAQRYNGSLYVELKDTPAHQVYEAIMAANMLDKCFFWSFDSALLQDLRAISDRARIMVRRQDFSTLEEALNFLSPDIIEYTMAEDWSEFVECRNSGLQVMIAYNGADRKEMQSIIDARPDMVNLDQPFLCRDMIQSARKSL